MPRAKQPTERKKSNRISAVGDGRGDVSPPKSSLQEIKIPELEQHSMTLWIIGDRPLMVNNKMNVAEAVSAQYSGRGKSANVRGAGPTEDEQYANSFYVMPSSKFRPPNPKGLYGVPGSGIKKCADKGARASGITDNTTIGNISKAFSIMSDEAGLCLIQFKKLERDIRPVNIGSGQKTVPQMRHRPMFHDWKIKLTILFNPRILSAEMIVNLFMHAGQYIGLCEMRAEKKQGECGGFVVSSSSG